MNDGPGDDLTTDLLRDYHRGERAALAKLIERNLDWVRNYVHRRLGEGLRRKAETHDLVQEAMLDVLVYGPRFEIGDEDQFRGLLAKIVENTIRDQNDWWRRKRRDIARERTADGRSVLQIGPIDDAVTSPSTAADRNEATEWLRLAMELLEPADRDVLWLREWDKLSFDEIGGRLGVSANTARMRFQRALPRLVRKVAELRSGAM